MPRYKRTADEAQLDLPITPDVAPENVEVLQKLRNMWEFASLMQYIYLFGNIVKIDENLDIEDLEAECLKPEPSPKLARIGLQLLKYVSSHRGLTPDIFDEYTRRQYVAKAPQRNPFGEDESPTSFASMDIFNRIRVLQQLTIWTLGNVQRIRDMMPQEEDCLNWRMEPLGWDRNDNTYFVLDDNRLYRRADIPVRPLTPPPVKSKAKSKVTKSSKSRPSRSSKRRKTEEMEDVEQTEEMDLDAAAGAQDETVITNGDHLDSEEHSGYGFTDRTWSLIAISLEEYDEFLSTIFRSHDPNEKQLHKRISDDVRPIIEKREEALRQKQLKKLREMENVQKIATAKRSTRLAGKAEKEKEDRERREAEETKDRDLKMAHDEEDRQRRVEEGHDSRRQTREQRLKEREVKRILHEEELAKLQEAEDRAASASHEPTVETAEAEADRKRASARQAQSAKEQHKTELARMAAEDHGDGKWYFDCAVCGMHGQNLDDGSHSLACDKCGVWQHSKCHNFTPKQAEKGGFTFICKSCKRQEIAEKDRPKIPPLRLGKKGGSSSANSPQDTKRVKGESNGVSQPSRPSRPSTSTPSAGFSKDSGLPPHVQRQLDGVYIPTNQPRPSPGPFGQLINGPSLSPHGQVQGPPGYRYPPVSNFAPLPQQPWQGSPFPPPARPLSSGYAGSASPQPLQNGARPSPGYAGTPPASQQHMINGYHPRQSPPHQQQHQYVHQQAVAAAGAHPGYAPLPQYQHQPLQQPANGGRHFQIAQPSGYPPVAQQQGHSQYHQPAPNVQYQREHPHHQQHQQRPVSAHVQHPQQHQYQPYAASPPPLMNGFQSPVKASAPLSHSPNPVLVPGAAYQQQQQQQQYMPPQSSPAAPSQPTPTIHGRPAPNLTVTPHHSQPQQQVPPSSSGGKIAEDGMSGPWPAGSQGIPRKHDRAPSFESSPMMGADLGGKVLAAAPGLTPSPVVQRVAGQAGADAAMGVIPVKKDVVGGSGISTGVAVNAIQGVAGAREIAGPGNGP
ncbi:hypothetical protein LTR54_015330 [Friedmanniomyces endolithicus]|uniref:PHD-type domain-containing protein n=1 Tax=Friedmanniomyces endolithicus TaxID=329885 RepID=A0AAN6F9X1_9PEZI|nr:hypothetical protein LTS00_014719 [Friedmanniomyces endolithicus]KAK0309085.1 hypothetical protein LTR82_015371 [Friedmanniomyces endolithicus]KAK0980518.1 hypothetical protein LTR54_015330 [Friedmanniomyces endolithicus]